MKALHESIQSRIPDVSEDLSQLLQSLGDVSCLPMWRAGLDSLITATGESGFPQWISAKQRALDILIQRDIAAESFERLEFTHKTVQVESFCDRIREKIELMEGFVAMHDTRPAHLKEFLPAEEPRYELYPLSSRRRNKKVAEAYPNIRQQVCHPHSNS